jgi:hypothetical protein
VIAEGQTTWVGLKFIWTDDRLVGLEVTHGPAKLLGGVKEFTDCMAQKVCKGIVSIQALDPVDSTVYGPDATGMYPVLIQAFMASGNSCSWYIWVEAADCPAEIPLAWDEDSSPETIGQGSAIVYISGGEGPFVWRVSGHDGFSMERSLTSDRVNRLTNDGGCGVATITVTDACGETVTGYLRSTLNSKWWSANNDQGDFLCVLPATEYQTSWYDGDYWMYYEAIVGAYKQQQMVNINACTAVISSASYPTPAEAEADIAERIGGCGAACLGDYSPCTGACYYEGELRGPDCYACLLWPTQFGQYQDQPFDSHGDRAGIGGYYSVFEVAPGAYQGKGKCICWASRKAWEWKCDS